MYKYKPGDAVWLTIRPTYNFVRATVVRCEDGDYLVRTIPGGHHEWVTERALRERTPDY